jgi:hypothetical protein
MKPEALQLARQIALNEVRRARAIADRHPMSDQRIANAAAKASGATVEQVSKWMKEMPNV